ncbi:hypothetical protein BDZ89DRAFT_923812, partial [Hymenopellis radicata]
DNNGRTFWGSPDSLIHRDNALLHVSNFSDEVITIAAGQILARAFNPRNWLDRVPKDEKTRIEQMQHAEFVRQMIVVKKGKEEIGLIQSRSTITSKAQRNATEQDDPSSSEPVEGGPKTADVAPEPTTTADFTTSVHISPDLTPEQRQALISVLERNTLAFGLDGRLGNHNAHVRIPMKPNAVPVSLPPFPASPANREVI